MSIDMEKIKRELENYENPQKGGGGGNSKLFKVDPGTTEKSVIVKLVPNKFNSSDPFINMWFHYGLAGQTVLCPRKNSNSSCPICDFGFEVLNKYKETKDEFLRSKLKVLLPKRRIFAPVVEIGEGVEPIVKLWGFSETVHKDLLMMTYEFGTAGITINDPENSPEIRITVTSPEKNGTSYSKTTIKEVKQGINTKISKLAESKKKIAEILDTCPDISEIYSERSHSEMLELLEKYAGSNKPSDSVGTEKNFSSEKNDAEAESDGDDIESKFEKMLNSEK